MVVTGMFASTGLAEPSSEDVEHFEKRVRPILAANCYSCHGAKRQESSLRLDSREAVLEGGDSGPAAIPGEPDASALVSAVRQSGDLKMPPEGRLQDNEIAALERWVSTGLTWPATIGSATDSAQAAVDKHWAYQPVTPPEVPQGLANTWEQNPVDRFVRSRMQGAELSPAPVAERKQLIRRLSFDLLGLPPDSGAVEHFARDESPDAVERLIDRMLASPNFGERWARHWLDVARYADNKGYVFFEEKSYPWAYTYRDYVIQAFNDDLPYDRFVTEQLAADQLELRDDRRALTAMGFLTIGGHFMNNTHDIIDDRMDVVTRGLMGLTVTCARCHDHKYDPIPQADYYSLYGVFRSCFEPTVLPMFEPPPATQEYEAFQVELEKRQKSLVDFVTQKYDELVTGARLRAAEYMLAAQALRGQPATDNFMLLVDKGDLNPAMLLRWRVYLEDPIRQNDPVWSIWCALATLSETEFSALAPQRMTTILSEGVPTNSLVRAAFKTPPLSLKEAAERYATLLNSIDERWRQTQNRAAASGNEAPTSLDDAAQEELRGVFYGPEAPPDVPISLDWGFLSLFPDRPTQAEYQKLLGELEKWMMEGAGAPPRAMVLMDSPRPYDPRIFLRGNPNRTGDAVPRQFLAVASSNRQPFVQGSGRLELARAVVSPSNPLTSRVIVNRIWMHHFGAGLVKTPGDFGLRSEPPSHPELLDWLASELLGDGGHDAAAWSLKRLHRRILTSASYQQSSQVVADAASRDPENGYLSHANRRRLDFESMRDAMLAVSGDLSTQMCGRPIPLLEGWNPRRTIYGVVDRLDTPTLLSTFDFPSPAVSSPQRGMTMVTPQALYALNNPFVWEAASRTARRGDVSAVPDVADRVVYLHQLVFGRKPGVQEIDVAKAYLNAAPDMDRWTNYVHSLLMANEFLFVD